MAPRIDCDVDYDDAAAQWFSAVQQEFLQQTTSGTSTSAQNEGAQVLEASTYSRKIHFTLKSLKI